MNEIDKIKRYIERTKLPGTPVNAYCLNIDEAFELAHQAQSVAAESIDVVSLIFDYGKAKGYRAARAEQRKAVRG